MITATEKIATLLLTKEVVLVKDLIKRPTHWICSDSSTWQLLMLHYYVLVLKLLKSYHWKRHHEPFHRYA